MPPPLSKNLSSMLLVSGRAIFAAAVVALGLETLLCAGTRAHSLGPQSASIPVIPWLPAIPWLARALGLGMVLGSLGLLSRRWRRNSALAISAFFFVCTLLLIVPKYAVKPADMGLRTAVFEPLSIAGLALLLLGREQRRLRQAGAILLSISLIVFGVDHFLDVRGIATLVPAWLPWHAFWIVFFGATLIASGLSIGLGYLPSWGMAGNGLVFAVWVITLHLPRVMGLYGIPGATRNPDEWSSLFIAVCLWGGSWAAVTPHSAAGDAPPPPAPDSRPSRSDDPRSASREIAHSQ